MRARGFTLVEVLLATVLLASALAIALAAVQGVSRATVSASARAEATDQLRSAFGFLRRQWAAAQPQPVAVPARPDALHFVALRDDRLVMVGELPGYLARGGLYVQTYTLRRAPGGQRLMFEYALIAGDRLLPPERPPEVLLEGLAQARFEARGLDPDGRIGPFAPRWERPGQLPMQLRLVARRADGRHLPELRVPLRYASGPAVVVDPADDGTAVGEVR
jgi:general secretion pathway protein J